MRSGPSREDKTLAIEVTKTMKSKAEIYSGRVGTQESNGEPVTMVTLGGDYLEGGLTDKSMKKRWKEIVDVASTPKSNEAPSKPPLAFGNQDLLDGKPNKYVLLFISVVMANVEVRRILIDQGSYVDIIFEDLLKVLSISMDDITPYHRMLLTGFNGSTANPLGCIELMVTYGDLDGERPLFRTVKTPFLVLPCKSYQCIIGRLTLGRLGAVTSTVHLKMKFYSLDNEIVTLKADLDAVRKCYYLSTKNLQ